MDRININGQSTETRNSANVKFFIFNNRKEYVVDYTNISNVGEIVEVLKKDFYLYYDINGVRGRIDLDKNLNSGNYMLMNKGEVVCEFNFNRMAGTNVNRVVGAVMSEIERIIESANEQVVEQEQENEDIDYLVTIFNEKMVEDITKDFESTLQTIAEYGDPSGENEHVCGRFNYERYYEHEWVEFYNEHGIGGINHAYEIFRNAPSFTNVDFFNEDSACYLVYELGDTYGVELEDNACEDCLVWVKNPYYKAPKDNAPCLDIDIAVDRVVNTIEKYLGSYTPSYLDQFGDCVITIGWDEFSEKDMQMLIEDDVFEGLVIDSLVGENISDVLVYDDGVYVTVDYDKMFDKSNVLNTLRREYALCDVDEYEMPINTLADRCGGYHVGLSDTGSIYVMYNKESDTYYVNGLGEDDDFAINEKLTSKTSYMELYDMITECIENNVNELKWVNETFFKSEIIENALESAIDSDDEYYDDAICQIGDWYVNYTSPCEEFPEGCVLVVDEKGCMYGNWCDVSDVDFAVEYLVGMIEKLNNEFNKVA